jgi:hypothetical protein
LGERPRQAPARVTEVAAESDEGHVLQACCSASQARINLHAHENEPGGQSFEERTSRDAVSLLNFAFIKTQS